MAIAPPDAKLSGTVMLYKNPEPLSAATHGRLGLNPSDTPYAVARTAHSVPVIVGEFGPASLSYPIVFSGADFMPLATMSVRPNENLFINEDGVFEDGNYIPAFLRRYPFVTAQTGGDGQFIVCIDRGAEILVEGGQTPLFEGDQPSQFTKDCLEFCSNFEADRRKTQDFVKMLRELDLFELRDVTLKPQNPDGSLGEVVKVTDYFTPAEGTGEGAAGIGADGHAEIRRHAADPPPLELALAMGAPDQHDLQALSRAADPRHAPA